MTTNEAVQLLSDERLTMVGLFEESHAGLHTELDRRLLLECGLSLQRFVLLLRLARSPDGRLRMSDLAGQTNLTPSGLTRAVDRLQDQGLVERIECPSDRRGSFATLTALGLERLTGALVPHMRHLDELYLAPLTESEQHQLAGLLRKLRDHVNPEAGRPPEPIPAADNQLVP